jgi:TPP-dependent pyruvate/acetoin dehydrogenase alpha subunit
MTTTGLGEPQAGSPPGAGPAHAEAWQAAREAVTRARDDGGPSFIEARTYRIQGHFEAEAFVLGDGRYRDTEEIVATTGCHRR